MPQVPTIFGISQLQRASKKVLDTVKREQKPVFLTERNKVSYVILSAEAYQKMNEEDFFWNQVQEKSLDFWHDPSEDIYNEL